MEPNKDSKEVGGISEVPNTELRIAQLEAQNSQILEMLKQITSTPQLNSQQNPQPQQKMDPAMIAQLLPLLSGGGSSDNSMDSFFNELGKRAFYNVFDKVMPSRKEVRGVMK